MKRLRLLRSISVNGAGHPEGAVVDVSDADAKRLLAGEVRAGTFAELVQDLGADVPVRPVTVRLLRACSVNGTPHPAGATVGVSERDARLLSALGKAEIVAGDVAPVATEDAGAVIAAAAASRPGPLIRVSSGRGGNK